MSQYDIYRVVVDEGATIVSESFMDEDSALSFAEEMWLMGKSVTVFKNDAIYFEYKV